MPAGRPKKKVEENPDCEPATKGFVKCLMRKTYEHRHYSGNNALATFLSWSLGGLATLTIYVTSVFDVSTSFRSFASSYLPFALLFVAITFVVWYDIESNNETGYTITHGVPEAIEKYKKPECKKDECE